MKIYFNYQSILREFYFVSIGKDESVYFGSAALRNFIRGCYADGEVLDKDAGMHVEYGQRIRPLTDYEKNGKYSYHKSGIFLCSNNEDNERDRYVLLPPDKFDTPIPLIGVIPMRIDKYPATKNEVRKGDIILSFRDGIMPFGMVIYLKRTPRDDPKWFLEKEKWSFNKLYVSKLGNYFLGVFLYIPTKPFVSWQELEIEIIARSKDNPEVPLWPICGN